MEAKTAGAQALAAAGEEEGGTRERILDAALESFESFGIKRTTMEDVAAAAGLGRVTLYRQYAGRDALIGAVVQREAGRFIAELDASLRPLGTLEELATAGFVHTLGALRSHPLFLRLYATEPETLLPFLTVEGEPVVAIGREYLAGLLARRGGGPPVRYEGVAEALVRLVQSFLLTPDSVVDLDDERALARFAGEVIVPMVTGRERGRGER